MALKRIFLLDGHPDETSLSRRLIEAYAEAARRAGHETRLTHLHDLEFDMDSGRGSYRDPKPMEPQIEEVLHNFQWADHVVMATPMWWGSLPAKLKGLIDRIFRPGTAFDPRTPNAYGLPSPLLTGKTGRVIITSDSPRLYLWLAHGNAMLRQIKGQIFGFVGIRPTRITYFSGASHPKPGAVEQWLVKVARQGARGI
jgi:NAD(P)H dehydrogenase (quinone)